MKNKVISLVLIAAMTASMVAGCGNKASESDAGGKTDNSASTTSTEKKSDSSEASASDEIKNKVTLKTVSMFGGTDANGPVYQQIIKDFMAENPNVTIEDNSAKADEEWKSTVAADFAVGNEPDVFQFFTDANAKTILETDKFVTIEEIKAEYPEYAQDILDNALDAAANLDGVQRAVPTTGFWEGLFCNKDLFEQYSLELPTDWESLTTAIKTFKENGIIPIACSLNNIPHYWIEHLMYYSSGAEEYTSIPTSAPEGWVKGLELLKTLRDMGAFPEDTDTVDDSYTGQLFRQKKAAMQLDGSWYVGNCKEDKITDTVTVVSFPGVEDSKVEKGGMVSGISSGFYITKKAWDDPDKRLAAVRFVEANTSKSAIQKYWEAGGSVSKAAVEVLPAGEMDQLSLDALEFSNSATEMVGPTDSRLGQEAYAILTSNAVAISIGEKSAEDVINEALAEYAKRNSGSAESTETPAE